MSVIDIHPQRQQIIEGILAGKSARSVARSAVPPLGHTTVASYRVKLLRSAAKQLRPQYDTSTIIKSYVGIPAADRQRESPSELLINTLRDELSGIVRSKLDRQNGAISIALQRKAVLDADGVHVLDADGKPVYDIDHRSFAAHDRNQTADLDFLGKLGQLYSEAPAGDAGVRALMSFGDVIINVGAPAATGHVIDAVAEEVVDVGKLRGR